MKTEIQLPALPKNDPIIASERSKVLEYFYEGKILTDEEAKELLKKWISYICKLVPKTKINYTSWTERFESSKESAISNKQSLINSYLILGKKVPEDSLARMDEKIVNAREDDSILQVQLFEACWMCTSEDGLYENYISSVDFCFRDGKELCRVWPHDVNNDNMYAVYIDSWEEGIKLYIEFGKKWLEDFAPEIKFPTII